MRLKLIGAVHRPEGYRKTDASGELGVPLRRTAQSWGACFSGRCQRWYASSRPASTCGPSGRHVGSRDVEVDRQQPGGAHEQIVGEHGVDGPDRRLTRVRAGAHPA